MVRPLSGTKIAIVAFVKAFVVVNKPIAAIGRGPGH
jgi:hypothetical protein